MTPERPVVAAERPEVDWDYLLGLPFRNWERGEEPPDDEDDSIAESAVKKPFDIADQATDTFAIMDNKGRENVVNIGVDFYTVDDGAGVTWDTVDRWDAAAISADAWVYIAVDVVAKTAYLTVGSARPTNTSRIENHILYFIPWLAEDGDVPAHIDWSSLIDLREKLGVPRLA